MIAIGRENSLLLYDLNKHHMTTHTYCAFSIHSTYIAIGHTHTHTPLLAVNLFRHSNQTWEIESCSWQLIWFAWVCIKWKSNHGCSSAVWPQRESLDRLYFYRNSLFQDDQIICAVISMRTHQAERVAYVSPPLPCKFICFVFLYPQWPRPSLHTVMMVSIYFGSFMRVYSVNRYFIISTIDAVSERERERVLVGEFE